MKKITLIAALLGSAYFANAQVGIGTPTPSASAMLDVSATNKGVLIPRVSLADSETVLVSGVAQENSLLVYNTEAKNVTGKEVKIGFYYWTNTGATPSEIGKWTRIVNQTDLDTAINNLTNHQADIDKIKALLDAAYGANNLGANPTTGTHGGMVYTPATGTFGQAGYIAPVVEYVKWDPAANGNAGGYVKVDVTSQLIDLIKGNETKTKIVNIGGNTYYISESFVGTEPTTAAEFETAANTAASGIYKVDFVNGVTKNFQEISTTVTNITKPGGGFYTVKEYIEFLSQNSQLNEDTKIVIDATTGKASLQQWNGTAWVAVNNSAFSTIVTDNETDTQITKNTTGTAVAGDLKIDYKYFNEAQPLTTGAAQQIIDVNADLKTLIEGNTEIRNAIQNILNSGGSVYYTETEIAAADNNGTLVPAKTLYIIKKVNGNDVKTPIDISGTVITAITNNSVTVKNILGDKIVNNTSVFTGNTININGTVYYIYKGEFDTSVTANTAVTTGITLDKKVIKILSMNLTYAGGISANVTNLVTGGTDNKTVAFNIGTGNMYQVLGTSNVNAKVIVEFASDVSPVIN